VGKKNRFSLDFLRQDTPRWFETRKRVFLYHYVSEPQVDPEWRDLSTTGCRYVGWVLLDYKTRAEIWLYPSEKHRTLVQMIVQPKNLMWKKQFLALQRERRKHDQQYVDKINQIIRSNSKFWFYS